MLAVIRLLDHSHSTWLWLSLGSMEAFDLNVRLILLHANFRATCISFQSSPDLSQGTGDKMTPYSIRTCFSLFFFSPKFFISVMMTYSYEQLLPIQSRINSIQYNIKQIPVSELGRPVLVFTKFVPG